MRTNLAAIRRRTTPEYLGPEATEADVATYLELLTEEWAEWCPVDQFVSMSVADAIQNVAFEAWCNGKRARR